MYWRRFIFLPYGEIVAGFVDRVLRGSLNGSDRSDFDAAVPRPFDEPASLPWSISNTASYLGRTFTDKTKYLASMRGKHLLILEHACMDAPKLPQNWISTKAIFINCQLIIYSRKCLIYNIEYSIYVNRFYFRGRQGWKWLPLCIDL